ncbi:MAG: glycosyltransferase [Pseudomonadota bacterium]
MTKLSYAVCTFDRADRLPRLLAAMRAQSTRLPLEVVVIDNNSSDNTREVVLAQARKPGVPIRYVFESEPGIVHARNRAIESTLDAAILAFIDDDELPSDGLLSSVENAILDEKADVVGGRINVHFEDRVRPPWLSDELLGFLGKSDYGDEPFWITTTDHPLWTGNIAYDVTLFRAFPELRFDARWNRVGKETGGGEDRMMFLEMRDRQFRMRYRPEMVIEHLVESSRLKRTYFLKLHYEAGRKNALFHLPDYPKSALGAPPFMYRQAVLAAWQAGGASLRRAPDRIRTAMNAMYALGMIKGTRERRSHASVSGTESRLGAPRDDEPRPNREDPRVTTNRPDASGLRRARSELHQ